MMAAPSQSPNPAAAQLHPVLRDLFAHPFPWSWRVLNVTPDSFSDGGRFAKPALALAQAKRMIAEGAGILDVGAESTRPYGSKPVSGDEELQRLRDILPTVAALETLVSIDTMKASVAAWALRNGATIANDVWGLQRDPDMARVIADQNAPVIVMHNRESVDPAIDIMTDMAAFFTRTLDIAAKRISRKETSSSTPVSASARRLSRA